MLFVGWQEGCLACKSFITTITNKFTVGELAWEAVPIPTSAIPTCTVPTTRPIMHTVVSFDREFPPIHRTPDVQTADGSACGFIIRELSINQSVNQSYIFRVAQVEKSTARATGRILMNVQETVRKWFSEQVSFEPLTKCGQRLSRRHILWQVVPDLWADNWKSSAADSW